MPKPKKPLATSYWLPVHETRHTSVCGYRASTADGRALWESLDWLCWWIDSLGGCDYFHVPVADDDVEQRWYRVRCWYAGGTYKRKPVVSVGIGYLDGRLHWIVRTKQETPA